MFVVTDWIWLIPALIAIVGLVAFVQLRNTRARAQAEVARAGEEASRALSARAAEDARLVAEATAAEDARRAAEAKAAEDARSAAKAKAAEDARRAAEAKAAKGPAVAAASGPGKKPEGIAAPLADKADDLKLIKGIGPKNEKICNDLGVYHFSQIADWVPDEAIWIGHHIALPGRIEREHWIAQAQLLASGADTEHSAGVKSGAIRIDASADAPLNDAQVKKLADSLPQRAAAVEGESQHDGRRPYGLAAPRGGAGDDLKRIRGIGPQNEQRLHALGIWHYNQIAAWSEENAKWIGSYLGFRGRIAREKWIEQAADLAAGRDSKPSRGAKIREVKAPKNDGEPGQA